MAATATAFPQAVLTTSRTTAPARFFSLRDLLDVFSKSLQMAQAVSDTGRPSSRQVEAVRKIADSI